MSIGCPIPANYNRSSCSVAIPWDHDGWFSRRILGLPRPKIHCDDQRRWRRNTLTVLRGLQATPTTRMQMLKTHKKLNLTITTIFNWGGALWRKGEEGSASEFTGWFVGLSPCENLVSADTEAESVRVNTETTSPQITHLQPCFGLQTYTVYFYIIVRAAWFADVRLLHSHTNLHTRFSVAASSSPLSWRSCRREECNMV